MAAAAILVVLGAIGRPLVGGLSFVIRAADMQGLARRAADLDRAAVAESLVQIPIAGAPIRGRLFRAKGASRAALLVSGLHPSGIDEPRLVDLARQLSASGLNVVTPDIPELSRFEIVPAITDEIERAAGWLSADPELSMNRPIGIMGISFSGGLSIVAAGRPSLGHRVAFVLALGGHDDLPRVIRYLCTGQEPYPSKQLGVSLKADGRTGEGGLTPQSDRAFVRAPHDYGVAVILLAVADRLVPPDQVAALRAGVRRYLWASALDGGVDKSKAADEFRAVTELADRLPEPAASLLKYLSARDVVHLGARLLPSIGPFGRDPALSPSKSPPPPAPVFVLHGRDDSVIPALEAEYLAEDLRSRGVTVRLAISGLISHAKADGAASLGELLGLASFWGDVLMH
jgi:dienelactone hydrolase